MCEHANIGGQNRTSFVDVRTSFVGDVRTGGDGCLRSYNLVQSRIYTSKKYTPSIIQSSAKLTKVFVPARKIVETSSSRAQEQFPRKEWKSWIPVAILNVLAVIIYTFFFAQNLISSTVKFLKIQFNEDFFLLLSRKCAYLVKHLRLRLLWN